jgi:L-asparaginase
MVQVVEAKKHQKIVLLGTGGTIAGTAQQLSRPGRYSAAQLGVEQLMAAVPDLPSALQGHALEAEQLAQLDSKDMDHATWQSLARRCAQLLADDSVAALVITHGTDTLEETAWFLQRVLQPSKPVVITCAMRAANVPGADGPQNLLDALRVARNGQRTGVLAVCAGRVHGARHVQKMHPSRLDAFGSGEAGPLGSVEAAQVCWADSHPNEAGSLVLSAALHRPVAAWPRVAVWLSHAGADRAALDALVGSGVQGLVLAGTGNGTLHRDLEAALVDARARGVALMLTTRCPLGQVEDHEGPDAVTDLNPVKARVELMLRLLEQPHASA